MQKIKDIRNITAILFVVAILVYLFSLGCIGSCSKDMLLGQSIGMYAAIIFFVALVIETVIIIKK